MPRVKKFLPTIPDNKLRDDNGEDGSCNSHFFVTQQHTALQFDTCTKTFYPVK